MWRHFDRFEIRDQETGDLIGTFRSLCLAFPYAMESAARLKRNVETIDRGAVVGCRQVIVVGPDGLVVEERIRLSR